MDVNIKWNGRMGFTGSGQSGHEVYMDTSEEAGGNDEGARPAEVALLSIGGCMGMVVTRSLQAMHLQVDDLEMDITSERAEEMPRRFTDINVHFRITGKDLPEERIKRAIDLADEKYCPVSNSFNANMTTSYEIIDDSAES